MEQTITCKLRLYPDEGSGHAMLETARAYKDACNQVSIFAYDNDLYVQRVLHDILYTHVRDCCFLGSQMACSTIKTVLAAYRSMRTNAKRKGKDPKDISRAEFKRPFYDLVHGKDYALSLDDSTVSLGTLDGRVKVEYSARGKEDKLRSGKLGTAKMVCKHGRFYLHVPVTIELPDVDYGKFENVVGVDRGERFLYTAYDSSGKTHFYSGKEVRSKKQHYRRVRKSLQKKHTPSARRRLKAIGQRENSWTQDVNHCASKALVALYDEPTLFAVEDLKGLAEVIAKRDGKTEKQRKAKDLLVSWAQYDLLQKIRYKAALAGHEVVEMNPAYTSQTCPKCGHVQKENRDKQTHAFECCNCHYRSNDDRVASMNLHRKGIEYLVQCQSDMSALDGACCQPSHDVTQPDPA